MSLGKRRYELIAFGASGFTGRQATAHLSRRGAASSLRWAIAGRNEHKLRELAAGLPDSRPDVLTAQATDSRSLADLARGTQAVISFLGPYGPVGDGLAEQCVAAGTHYADLCGENDVIARRVACLHEPARIAGVKLIPACGYESVPFDIAVLALNEAFRDVDGSRVQAVDVEVRFLFHRNPLWFGHGNSGGTVATVARLAESRELTDTGSFARAAGALDGLAETATLDLRARRLPHGDWLAPLLPTPFLNPAVIRLTSFRLAEGSGGYADALTYREMLNASASLRSRALAALIARGASFSFSRIAAMSHGRRRLGDRIFAAALKALAPTPGDGPSPSSLDAIDYRIELRARSTSGLESRGSVDGRGHPGYRSAANILAEAGIALARADGLPRRAGVLTPATGLGMEFVPALHHAGVAFAGPTAAAPAKSDRSAFDYSTCTSP